MTAQAIAYYGDDEQKYVTLQAQTSGDIVQLPDSRAAVVQGLTAKAVNDPVSGATTGVYKILKPTAVAILRGGDVFWRRASASAHFSAGTDGFYIGKAAADCAATDTFCVVDLNAVSRDRVNLRDGLWTSTAVGAAGSPLVARQAVGKGYVATLDSTNEAQKIDAISVDTVRDADGPIFEGRLTIHTNAATNAMTCFFGLANGTHATAFTSITEYCGFEIVGNSLALNAISTDGTTTVAKTDTTVAAVADTYNEFWIDARDLTNVKLYIDGVRVLASSTFKLNAATGPMKALFWLGKTSSAVVANIVVDSLRVRTSD